MSRVIKAAIWEENPHLIHTPEPPKPEKAADGDSGLDEETRTRMLAEIAAKEQRAIQLLKDAKVDAEILKQEAMAECERMKAEAQEEIKNLKEEAIEAGHQEGYEAGYKDGEDKIREEMEAAIGKYTKEQLFKVARNLAHALKEIGDHFDIMAGSAEEENEVG